MHIHAGEAVSIDLEARDFGGIELVAQHHATEFWRSAATFVKQCDVVGIDIDQRSQTFKYVFKVLNTFGDNFQLVGGQVFG